MTNVWGYSHLSFFAPMSRFATRRADGQPSGAAVAREFKEMVRALHAAGIEVRGAAAAAVARAAAFKKKGA